MNYPLCGFGLYDGNVGLLDLRTAELICITETSPHPTSRNGRESDKVDEAIVCLNGEYDGGGVTSIDLQLGVMVTGGRDGRVYVWELRGLRKEGFEFGRPKPHVLRAGGVVGGVLIGEDNGERNVWEYLGGAMRGVQGLFLTLLNFERRRYNHEHVRNCQNFHEGAGWGIRGTDEEVVRQPDSLRCEITLGKRRRRAFVLGRVGRRQNNKAGWQNTKNRIRA